MLAARAERYRIAAQIEADLEAKLQAEEEEDD